jgi:hypothetical protein
MRVLSLGGRNALLRLEDSVAAFGRNYDLPLMTEDERRVLPIEDHNVDLIAECAFAVDHMRFRRLVAPRQIGLQHLEPDNLARVALAHRVGAALLGGWGMSFHPSPQQAVAIAGIKTWFTRERHERQVFRLFGYPSRSLVFAPRSGRVCRRWNAGDAWVKLILVAGPQADAAGACGVSGRDVA